MDETIERYMFQDQDGNEVPYYSNNYPEAINIAREHNYKIILVRYVLHEVVEVDPKTGMKR